MLALYAAGAFADLSAAVSAHYRHQSGDIAVTALLDGMIYVPRAQLAGISSGHTETLLREAFSPEYEKGVAAAVNAFVIRRGNETVLEDAGTQQ